METEKQKTPQTNSPRPTMAIPKTPYITMVVYGVAGSGKSIFASTFPSALILDADNGHKLYERFYPQHTYVRGNLCIPTLQKAVKQLQSEGQLTTRDGKRIETIVIDSLTNLENLAIANLKGMNVQNWDTHLYTNKGKKLDYNEWGGISGSTISLLTFLRELPINLVVITQVETTSDNGRNRYVPNLIGKGSDEAAHFADFTGFMSVDSTNDGIERYLHLSSTIQDNFIAKSRTVQGVVEPIKNPNYEKILQLVTNQKMNLNFSE